MLNFIFYPYVKNVPRLWLIRNGKTANLEMIIMRERFILRDVERGGMARRAEQMGKDKGLSGVRNRRRVWPTASMGVFLGRNE